MGALKRATLAEVEDLVSGDSSWWPGFCMAVAESGSAALKSEIEMRGWSWGALWKWITADSGRYAEYEQALGAYAQRLAMETVGIADGSEDAAVGGLRVKTRQWLAGKLDRDRYGDRVKVDRGSAPLLDAALVGFAGALLERLARPQERVVEAAPRMQVDKHSQDNLAFPAEQSEHVETADATDEI